MPKIKNSIFLLASLLVGLLFFITTSTALASENKKSTDDKRLYVLNCGYIDIPDFSSFSDTNSYPHTPVRLADPCFLIKNPKGWLIWDLGLGDQYVNHPTLDKQVNVKLIVPVSLTSQLEKLGLTPQDIKYVALSHTHFDHMGNANLFKHATWLLQRKEYQFTQKEPLSPPLSKDLIKILEGANKILLDGDYDVFGDGSVIILSTPGHTPGHQSLKVVLPHHGVIILSGDLYHARKSYLTKQIPSFNTSRAETMASMSRISGILSNAKAGLIIQHDAQDFANLPKPPKFLD